DRASLGGGLEYELFRDLVRASLLCRRAEESQQPATRLALAREASALLSHYSPDASLHAYSRLWIVNSLGKLSSVLRKGGAVEEALSLGQRAVHILQEAIRQG